MPLPLCDLPKEVHLNPGYLCLLRGVYLRAIARHIHWVEYNAILDEARDDTESEGMSVCVLSSSRARGARTVLAYTIPRSLRRGTCRSKIPKSRMGSSCGHLNVAFTYA